MYCRSEVPLGDHPVAWQRRTARPPASFRLGLRSSKLGSLSFNCATLIFFGSLVALFHNKDFRVCAISVRYLLPQTLGLIQKVEMKIYTIPAIPAIRETGEKK